MLHAALPFSPSVLSPKSVPGSGACKRTLTEFGQRRRWAVEVGVCCFLRLALDLGPPVAILSPLELLVLLLN